MKFSWLRNFFDALDSPGGHICICVGLLVGYARLVNSPLAHDIAVFALGVLSRSMGTAKGNADPPASVVPAASVEPPPENAQ